MPLIIAILVIIVVLLNIRDKERTNSKLSANREKDRRKTNAALEQQTLDMYMKHGCSFEEAFRKTYADMISAGYSPCIPRQAYNKNQDGVQSSFCAYKGFFNPEGYDSFWVQERREQARRQWQQDHPSIHLAFAPREEIDRLTYREFPKTESQYLYDLKRSAAKASAAPIGTFIIYPELGTCEVINHNWVGGGAFGGTYTLRVLETDQIVTHVKIGDDKIRRQGD